jgi:acyl-CoA thioester hydrolase
MNRNFKTKIRVRYGETDRMGYCYYGNYAQFFEVARVEALRELGFSYKKLEDDGILLPVSEFSVKYLRPAYYDDELTIHTKIESIDGVKLNFYFETYKDDKLLNTSKVQLVFVDAKTGRPTRPPKELENKIKS